MEFSSEMEMKFAFERDMVRRRGKVSNAGIIVLCVECEEDFDRRSGTHVVCDDCKAQRVRDQTRERVRRFRERNPYESQSRAAVTQKIAETADPWTNVMLAVCQNAAEDGDTEWLEANKDVYTQAILGRRLDG